MVALLVGCSTDTPTAPTQEPSTPTPGINAFIMSISVSPDSLQAGSESPATVNVRATDRVTGASPPNGTTVQVSTTLGEFQELGSEIQVTAAVFDQGRARVFLCAGDTVGTASLRADLSGSVGRTTVDILGQPVAPFVTNMSPTSGTEDGGTTVTFTGTGFREPLRVNFGGKLATVTSVSNTEIKAVTPPAEIEPTPCDTDDFDDDLDGVLKNNLTVGVTIELSDGTTSDSFQYTYTVPLPGVCVGVGGVV
jgi:hypothetical protein